MAVETQKAQTLTPKEAGAALIKVAALAIFLNLSLALGKFLLGVYCGSLALKADALHSLTDVVGSFSVFLGLKFAERKSEAFPYGLYKLENLAALISSLFIFGAAYEIIKMALFHRTQISAERVPVAAAGLITMGLLTWAFSRWEAKLARASGSPSLAADAEHMKSEFLTLGVILLGLMGGALGLPWADRGAAVLVSAFILKIGARILIDSLKVLLDAGLEPEIIARIADLIRAFPEVIAIKRLTGRRSGRFRFLEAEIVLDVNSLEEAHEIVTMIEEEIYDHFPEIDRVIIHFEPPVVEEYTLAVPVEDGEISHHFGCAPSFLLLKIDCREEKGKIREEMRLDNPFLEDEKRRGIKVAEWLHQKGAQAVLIPDQKPETRGFFYALTALGIRPIWRPGITMDKLREDPPCPGLEIKNKRV